MFKTGIMDKLRYIHSSLSASLLGFVKDDCFSKASSLTFYTLLSIVPILAVALGIAKGFGFENYLRSVIRTRIEQGEIANQLISFAYNALEESHSGVIASVGLLLLLWTAIQLLSKIEYALNEIWEVKTQRSYGRQFSDYLAITILCPIFFVASSSLSIYVVTLLRDIPDQNTFIKVAGPYLLNGLRLIPYILNWILFSLMYIILPNTTVQWRWAIFGGIVSGTLYQVINWIYIHFQIGVSNYSAIYGSFAALPLFLVWVNVSWQIVLLGAEMACHFERPSEMAGGIAETASKKYIALAVCTYCASLFLQGKKAPLISQIAHEIGTTQRVTGFIAQTLFEANILAKNQEGGFLPAKSPEDINMKGIFDIFEEKSMTYTIVRRPHGSYYENILAQFDLALRESKDNLSLKDLACGLEIK